MSESHCFHSAIHAYCGGHLCLIRARANPKSEEEHPCPYHTHINANPDYRCRCCEACQQNCQDDV